MTQQSICKLKLLFLSVSLITTVLNAQNPEEKKDSLVNENTESTSLKKKAAKGDVFVGVDVFLPSLSLFSDRKEFQAMIQYRLHNAWHVVAEAGYGKNKYDENGWQSEVDGTFGKIGFNWFLSEDKQNINNGFYAGLRFAYANYNQTFHKYPIRDVTTGNVVDVGSLPQKKVDAYWTEIVVGARLDLVKNLCIDFSLHPAFYIGAKRDNGFEPKIIPGYGRNTTTMNLPVFWGITYKLF
ncbi:DUF6048 family protein [Weeksella virosa]|uniref:DUF6048 family protein n=1 Tax=Weeksella virosa TaxID=1014 RepID=UPI000F84C99B|nr:DUF6048 family protein [Weeksella virosa]MDK7375679.1 DUF6048 family protein [Weeksella virosa]MDK7675008.1 DUF6048 family protein [Weeksella virosa]